MVIEICTWLHPCEQRRESGTREGKWLREKKRERESETRGGGGGGERDRQTERERDR